MNLKVPSPHYQLWFSVNPSPFVRNAFLSVVFLFLFIGGLAPAAGWARELNWSSLNLTSQQETQMNQLENNWEKNHRDVSSQIDKDMAELKKILPTGDTQQIRQLQNRIMSNKMYLMKESMDTFLRKRDMLTPPQRVQLQKMLPCKSGQ